MHAYEFDLLTIIIGSDDVFVVLFAYFCGYLRSIGVYNSCHVANTILLYDVRVFPRAFTSFYVL